MDENTIKKIEAETHTLSLQWGSKWNEATGDGALASLFISRKSCVVFLPCLPKGRKPEGRARLKVVALRDPQNNLRLDRSQNPMFRSTPAPVQYEDRWRENADGSISRFTFSINWLLEEREEGECEKRQPATKQEPGQKPPVNRVVWGTDLSTCKVQKIVTPTTVTFREVIVDMEKELNSPGGVVPHMTRVSEVDGTPYVAAEWAAKAVAVITPQPQYLQVDYGSDLQFYLNIWTATPMDSQREQLAMYETWGNLPLWVQQHITTEYYPLCSCGRERWSTREQHDGYQKCAVCRTEEACSRCGKSEHPGGKITLTSTGMICRQCESRLPLEHLVANHVSSARRREVVVEAKRLLSAKALEREVGEMVLEATLGHIASKRALEDALRDRTGYAWYYWSEDGVYGSKFSPEALQLLSFYAQAKADGLITFTAWLTGRYQKVAECEQYGDFYWKTQVKGEGLEPTFSSGELGQPLVVVTKVLGRAADRTAALAGHQRLVEKLGKDALQVYEVWQVLCCADQNYTEALQKIAAAEETVRLKEESERRRADTEARLPELLREHYSICPICCEAIKWSEVRLEDSSQSSAQDGAYLCDCLNGSLDKAATARQALQARWGEVQAEFGHRSRRRGTVLRRTALGSDKFAVQVVAHHRDGRWNLVLLTYPDHFGELGNWQTETVWRVPTELEMRLQELKRLRESYVTSASQADEQVDSGRVMKLQFRKEDRDGKNQLVSGNRKQGLLYVVDKGWVDKVVVGRWYFCSELRVLIDQPQFRLAVVTPFLEANLDIDGEIARLERDIARGLQSLEPVGLPVLPPKPAASAVDLSKLQTGMTSGGLKISSRGQQRRR